MPNYYDLLCYFPFSKPIGHRYRKPQPTMPQLNLTETVSLLTNIPKKSKFYGSNKQREVTHSIDNIYPVTKQPTVWK